MLKAMFRAVGNGKWGMGIAVVAMAAVLFAACGGGGEESGEEIAKKVADAIEEPGMVYHAVGDDGSEVWIDAENEVFRERGPTSEGELISVGEGWNVIGFDAIENEVFQEDANPTGPVRPRIDHPMVAWLEALQALAFGQNLRELGETVADGNVVLVVEARTPIVRDNEPTGGELVGRVEVDRDTYLPHAFERSEVAPLGETPGQDRVRVLYTTSELIPRSDLPEDFFDQAIVEAQVLTTEESIGQLRDLGLTPYWLGRGYESQLGQLELPPKDAVITDPEMTMGELRYALIVPVNTTGGAQPLLDTVIVRLGLDPLAFRPPSLPEIAGELPEDFKEVEVRDGMGTLFTSVLSPGDLGCDEAECPVTTAKVYRRLIFVIEGTAIQIETFARVSPTGDDLNGYNTENGIRALAETIMELTEEDEVTAE